jgi:nucleotide-binding universal stress UspA family protein
MFKGILVGVDGSPTANEALRRAALLAGSTGAELHVVCAYQNAALTALAPAGGIDLGSGSDSMLGSLKQAAEEVLGAAMKELGDAGPVKVQTHVVEGEPSDVLIDSAETLGCDLIVVGNRGMRGGKRLLLGSVPNRVAHHAGCDVMIVHTS